MHQYSNTNNQLRLLKEHNDTFLLHQLQFDASTSHAFDLGSFFNRQQVGIKLKDLMSDDRLKKWLVPLATFYGSGDSQNKHSITSKEDTYTSEDEFVAIAEGADLPLYIFTYNIEMTQFAYTNLMKNPEQEEIIDKSIPSRHHAQFIC